MVECRKSSNTFFVNYSKAQLEGTGSKVDNLAMLNKNIHFQPVPSREEIESLLPDSKFIVKARDFSFGKGHDF